MSLVCTETHPTAFREEKRERRNSVLLQCSVLVDFDDSMIATGRVSQCPRDGF